MRSFRDDFRLEHRNCYRANGRWRCFLELRAKAFAEACSITMDNSTMRGTLSLYCEHSKISTALQLIMSRPQECCSETGRPWAFRRGTLKELRSLSCSLKWW